MNPAKWTPDPFHLPLHSDEKGGVSIFAGVEKRLLSIFDLRKVIRWGKGSLAGSWGGRICFPKPSPFGLHRFFHKIIGERQIGGRTPCHASLSFFQHTSIVI